MEADENERVRQVTAPLAAAAEEERVVFSHGGHIRKGDIVATSELERRVRRKREVCR